MVVLDLADVPETTLARVPRSTWLRLQRIVEGTEIALLLIAAAPVARSAGGLSIATGAAEPEAGVTQAAGTARRSGATAAGGTVPGLAVRSTVVWWKGAHARTRRLGGLSTRLRATSPRGYVGELPLAIG
jgi:hypothetical protein